MDILGGGKIKTFLKLQGEPEILKITFVLYGFPRIQFKGHGTHFFIDFIP